MATPTPFTKAQIEALDNDSCSCFDCERETVDGLDEDLFAGDEEAKDLTVQRIWREKMAKSYIFLPTEIEDVLPYWMEFITHRCGVSTARNADMFRTETAEIIAEQFKCYPLHGWGCLVKECPQKPIQCLESDEPESSPTEEGEGSALSLGDINDALAQADFLLRMICSNDFSLLLVKAALDPNFKPHGVAIKSPYEFHIPKTYLHLKRDSMEPKAIRDNLLEGQYDDYILPLAMSNEVNEQFWLKTKREFYEEEFGQL